MYTIGIDFDRAHRNLDIRHSSIPHAKLVDEKTGVGTTAKQIQMASKNMCNFMDQHDKQRGTKRRTPESDLTPVEGVFQINDRRLKLASTLVIVKPFGTPEFCTLWSKSSCRHLAQIGSQTSAPDAQSGMKSDGVCPRARLTPNHRIDTSVRHYFQG